MANSVDPSKKRIAKQYMLSPAAIAIIEREAPRFARGCRPGGSRALEEMVLFFDQCKQNMENG